jgi:hypothetical protein
MEMKEASIGLKVEDSNNKHLNKIYNKAYVINRLRRGEITLDKYHYAIQHDINCIIAALSYDINEYNLLDDEMKSNPDLLKAIKEMQKINQEIDECWKNYHEQKNQEDEESDKYASIFPDYVAVEIAVHDAKEKGNDPIKSIIAIVSHLNDEEYENLKDELEDRRFSTEFINPSMSFESAMALDTLIDTKRRLNRNLLHISNGSARTRENK